MSVFRLRTQRLTSLRDLPSLRAHSANEVYPSFSVNVTAAAPGRTDAGPRKYSFPDDWAELVPELEQQADDYLVSKQRVGAFIGTSLDEYLRQLGVTQVFLTGIATSVGVESTARSAYDFGYNVAVVVDAITDMGRGDAPLLCGEGVSPDK